MFLSISTCPKSLSSSFAVCSKTSTSSALIIFNFRSSCIRVDGILMGILFYWGENICFSGVARFNRRFSKLNQGFVGLIFKNRKIQVYIGRAFKIVLFYVNRQRYRRGPGTGGLRIRKRKNENH